MFVMQMSSPMYMIESKSGEVHPGKELLLRRTEVFQQDVKGLACLGLGFVEDLVFAVCTTREESGSLEPLSYWL